jgi:formylglycine-generating enzyme required for sulfatase activity
MDNVFKLVLALFLTATISSCNRVSDQEFEVNGVKFKMIAVEGGSFMMGATPGQGDDARENEKPAHKVTVDDFLIGETEVTQELWFAVMGNNPSVFKYKAGNYPVENVSWNDVHVFIKKLNEITCQQFRLPFEAEWEYAARGGKKSTDKKYSGSDDIDEVAWYKDNAIGTTHAVATKKANELGLYDMSGNVWEWCEDWYGNYTGDEQYNQQGTLGRNEMVMRGGSWYNLINISGRRNYKPETLGSDYGFRLLINN